MSYRVANAHLVPAGVRIDYRASWREYRVNYIDGKDTTAYYTQDEQDAVLTAQAMVRQRAADTAFNALRS